MFLFYLLDQKDIVCNSEFQNVLSITECVQQQYRLIIQLLTDDD